MEVLSIEDFKVMINVTLENIKSRELEFSQLDSIAGDGDHGTAMVAAFNAVNEECEKGSEFKAMLLDMAMNAMTKTSGSISTLIGAFLMGMSDKAEGVELSAKQVADMFASGLAGVQQQTQAQVGDKTIMDSLVPAVKAMSGLDTIDVEAILNTGANAALKGAEETKKMVSKFGRARNLGEKSLGHIDPGACSWASMFESFNQAYIEKNKLTITK